MDPAVTSPSICVFVIVSHGLRYASCAEDKKNKSRLSWTERFTISVSKLLIVSSFSANIGLNQSELLAVIWCCFIKGEESCDCEDELLATTVCCSGADTTTRSDPHLLPFPLPLPFVTHYKHPNQLEQMIMSVLHFEHGKLCNIFSTKLGGP